MLTFSLGNANEFPTCCEKNCQNSTVNSVSFKYTLSIVEEKLELTILSPAIAKKGMLENDVLFNGL